MALVDVQTSEWFFRKMATRRSVRQFLDKKICDEVIVNAIQAASTAPSGASRQPWHFSVVGDGSLKSKIRSAAENIENDFYSNQKNKDWISDLKFLNTNRSKPFLEMNSHLIVVSAKTCLEPLEEYHCTKKSYYPKESVAIAIGMLITSLHLSGVATLTHTPKPTDFLIELLNLGPHTKPFMIIVVGYPSPEFVPPNLKKRSLDEIATFYK